MKLRTISDGRDQCRHILPRSRHRPLASTDGSVTENLNKTGVRLWTDPSSVFGAMSESNLVVSAAFIAADSLE